VRFVGWVACIILAGCSQTRVESAAESKELIPAEWTVADDTSAAGDITTLSVQLPLARQISGLGTDQPPRLVLRCVDHRIQAFIDAEADGSTADVSTEADTSASTLIVPIQLDSAPACD
jgi:hypothetical protein